MRLLKRSKTHAVLVGLILVTAMFLLEDCDSGGSNAPSTCSIPSLLEDWGNKYYQFTNDANGEPLMAISDGQSVIAGGIYHDSRGTAYPMALTGPVLDRLNADLIDGGIDYNWNGEIEDNEMISSMTGKLNISDGMIEIFEVIIENRSQADLSGSCVRSGNVAPQLSPVVARVMELYNQGSDDNDGGGKPFSCSGPGWETDDNKAVYYFRDPIRIGDDVNYNDHHDPDFRISSPTGLSYSATFEVPAECHFSDARIQYTIAGAMEAAKVYLNGSLVGRTCNPGNTANAIKRCDDINITSRLRTGSNKLKVQTVLYPLDDFQPYDDIEIYNMRVTLTR